MQVTSSNVYFGYIKLNYNICDKLIEIIFPFVINYQYWRIQAIRQEEKICFPAQVLFWLTQKLTCLNIWENFPHLFVYLFISSIGDILLILADTGHTI